MIVNQNTANVFLTSSKKFLESVSGNEKVIKNLKTLNFSESNVKGILDLFKESDEANNTYFEMIKGGIHNKLLFDQKLQPAVTIAEKHTELLKLLIKKNVVDKSVLVLTEPRFYLLTDFWLAAAAYQYEKILDTPAALKGLEEEYKVSREEVEKGKEIVWLAKNEREIYARTNPQIISQVKKRHALFMKLESAVSELVVLTRIACAGDSELLDEIVFPDFEIILSNFYNPPDEKMVKDSSIT
jgi:hypothetical protein